MNYIDRKYIARIFLCAIAGMTPGVIFAAPCTLSNPVALNYNIGTFQVTNPDNNAGSTDLGETKQVNAPSKSYTLSCSCSGRYNQLHGTAWGDGATINSNGRTYFSINEYLAAATAIYSQGTYTWVNTPANDITNMASGYGCGDGSLMLGDTHSFSRVKFYLYIKKPFVGTVSIPQTTVTNLSLDTTENAGRGEVAIKYTLQGTIVVPQSCTVNSGQVIDIDFGSIAASDFASGGAGGMPTGFLPHSKSISVNCTGGVQSTASLTLRLEGAPASNTYPDALRTSNPDIGVQITDASNNHLKPNDPNSKMPFNLNDNQAVVTIKAYPVSLTGNPPAAGTFTTVALLRVDFN
ncbi:fimbrial protein [Burkholderia cepacia]|uniref:fimbrial protein n=1 Tax=Burkholderia cepacia TaxID=292 RepID=UPI0009BB0A4C|nr:fimbrial protein [Burkholderia cepacia]